jgi:hypothetical protein
MWMVMRHSHYNLYEDKWIPFSYCQIILDILSKNSCHQFRKFLYFQIFFLVLIHKKFYYEKLRKNWNASMCVDKQTMQDLQRERSIKSSTWWLPFFVSWAPSFHWLWWLTNIFSKTSLCNFMWEGFGFLTIG